MAKIETITTTEGEKECPHCKKTFPIKIKTYVFGWKLTEEYITEKGDYSPHNEYNCKYNTIKSILRVEQNYRWQDLECCNNCRHSGSFQDDTEKYCKLNKQPFEVDVLGICDKYE